ncbi:hypothetical protein JVT61DRAFT_840 [Boletus reticuloceps]|uniref:Uncharacterized protein n=1 Tax=Boletus reticuloceps TaxID=495285 RepID=A0A8I3AH11_9AGAM|nr:hypothetical protein JVT61DRAFT_840 [Boletus reticuloceps]
MIIQPAHSTTSSSSPTASALAAPRDHVYKGKYTHRSWQQLPPELVRTIATHHLLDLQPTSYCPLTWDAKELWHPRIVYTTLRDAIALEKLMQVTPAWAAALETHLFWNKACAVLDPHDVLINYQFVRPQPPLSSAAGGAAPTHLQLSYRISPFRHFRQMTARTCYVCRINTPSTSVGLAVAKRTYHTPTLGSIALCREHRKSSFCGLCLREAPPAETDPQFDMQGNTIRFTPYHQPYGPTNQLNMGVTAYTTPLNPALMVCCAENEDDETWPNVDATCRSCRGEWLWQRISTSLRDREAVGGPRFVPSSSRASSIKDRITQSRYSPAKYASADWETRQTVDAFIDLGEGSITEVLAVAREKFWLRSQTKMPELMEQAVAATRWAGEGMGVDFVPHTPVHQTVEHASANNSSSAGAAPGAINGPGRCASPSPPSPHSVHRSRSPSPRSVYSSEYEGSEEDEDPELLSLTEDAGGVRELAIADWARTRILDGHWCNPADQWYGYAWPAGGGVRDVGEDTESEPDPDEDMREGCTVRRVLRVDAVHPCPWTVTSNSISITSPTSPTSPNSPASCMSNESNGDDIHPRLSTVRAHAPPSFTLCEQAYHAYQKQLRLILLPAMTNLVRKFVMEWSYGVVGAGDPATRVAKMGLEEVLAELKAPGVWFDGVDWTAGGLQRDNDRHSASARERDNESGRDRESEREREREEDSASSASSRSGGSHTTSPVLSTTTLQTTPSPPPTHEKDKCAGERDATLRKQPPSVAIPIPISPVLPSPRLIHPIPYVPVTLVHMAQYSFEAFKNVWREACAPLYHCRCTICERAMVRANMAAGHTVPSQGQAPGSGGHANSSPNVNTGATQQAPVVHQSHPHPHGTQQGHQPTEIVLEEVHTAPRHVLAQEEEEEEEMYEEEEDEEEEGDEEVEEEEEEESEDSSVGAYTLVHPRVHTPTHPQTHAKIAPPRLNPRKRSSDDLDGDAAPGTTGTEGGGTRAGTPPKRVKVGPTGSEERTTHDGTVKGSRATSVPSTPTRGGTVVGGTDKATLETTTTPTSRQRKRSSEELEVSGSASPRSTGDDKQQKRLRVEPSVPVSVSPSKNRSVHTRTRGNGTKGLRSSRSPRARSTSTPTPATGSASPPSSVTMTSVDVDVDGVGALKAGLVNGGELDGLYVFEET